MLLPILLLKYCQETHTDLLAHVQAGSPSDISPNIGEQEVGASANHLLLLFLTVGWILEHLSKCYVGYVWGKKMMKCLGGVCGCRYLWVTKTEVWLRKELWWQDLYSERLEPHLSGKSPAEVGSWEFQRCGTFEFTLWADAGFRSCYVLKSCSLSSLTSTCASCWLQGLKGVSKCFKGC